MLIGTVLRYGLGCPTGKVSRKKKAVNRASLPLSHREREQGLSCFGARECLRAT